MMTAEILDTSIEFNWNGIAVRFDDWADDDYGVFDYVTRNRRHALRYHLKEAENGTVEVILKKIDRQIPTRDFERRYPGTFWENPVLKLAFADGIQPTRVPEALLLLVIWAESTGFSGH